MSKFRKVQIVRTFSANDWNHPESKHFVIPVFEASTVKKVKIRKSEWQEGDLYGKYFEVPGSSSALPLFGDPAIEATVVVEAEFDALLIDQEAGDLCNCLALGGAQKRPAHSLREWLLRRRLILFGLDFDDAGKKEYLYWHQSFPNLEPWPIPDEKSPGDYFAKGGSLRDWISTGVSCSSL